METNMKLHVQIVLLLLTIAGVIGTGGHFLDYSLKSTISALDVYGNRVDVDMVLIDTKFDTGESNYPNTILFYLYTRDRRNDSVQLHIGNTDSLKVGQFDPKKPTVFITHGWLNSHKSPACVYVRDAYFQNGDYNVILIDWSAISNREYVWVTTKIKSVAQYVSRMIDFLASQGMDPSNTTVVGHSLGAHVAGLASYYAKQKVNYIVGLDPAGPLFHLLGTGLRLSKEDGTYVQAIHTTNIFGLHEELGHADFYVEGGIDQLGCIVPVICGHLRSYEYFAESLNSKGFIARRCTNIIDYDLGKCILNDAAVMGGVTPNYDVTGAYYLNVNLKPPFAKY